MRSLKFKLFIVAVFTLFLANCDTDSDSIGDPLVLKYPLSKGNEWTYDKTMYSYIKEDSGAVDVNTVYIDTTEQFFTKYQVITGDSLLNDSLPSYKLLTTEINYTTKQSTGALTSYYWNYEDGLYSYQIPLDRLSKEETSKADEPKKYRFKNISFNDFSELKVILDNIATSGTKYDDRYPVLQIAYPITVGNEWIVNSISPVKRRIIGTETIETQAGLYLAYKIQTFFDLDEDGNIDEDIIYIQYLCGYGIVKTYTQYNNVIETTPIYPDGTGNFIDFYETELLTDFNINL
jgi:hypothetical protein